MSVQRHPVVVAGNRLSKAIEDLNVKCAVDPPNLRTVHLRLNQVRAQWEAYNREYDAWAITAPE